MWPHSQLGVLCHQQELLAVHLAQRPRVQQLQEGLLPLLCHKLLIRSGQVLQHLAVHVGGDLDGGGVAGPLTGKEGEQTPNLGGLCRWTMAKGTLTAAVNLTLSLTPHIHYPLTHTLTPSSLPTLPTLPPHCEGPLLPGVICALVNDPHQHLHNLLTRGQTSPHCQVKLWLLKGLMMEGGVMTSLSGETPTQPSCNGVTHQCQHIEEFPGIKK